MHELLGKDDDPHESHEALQFNKDNNHGVVVDNAVHLIEFSHSFGLSNVEPP